MYRFLVFSKYCSVVVHSTVQVFDQLCFTMRRVKTHARMNKSHTQQIEDKEEEQM